MRVRDVMSMNVVEVPAEASCQRAAQLMRDHDVGMLVVTRPGRILEGVITDRDLVTHHVAGGADPTQCRVGEYMDREPATVDSDVDLERAIDVMRTTRHRRLPVVVTGRKVIGLLSLDDIALDVRHYTDAFLAVAGQYARRSAADNGEIADD